MPANPRPRNLPVRRSLAHPMGGAAQPYRADVGGIVLVSLLGAITAGGAILLYLRVWS